MFTGRVLFIFDQLILYCFPVISLPNNSDIYQRFGYMLSDNGIQWSKPQIIDLNAHPSKWWGLTRTPLGLISEGDNNYTLFFTAYNKNFYEIPGIWSAKNDSVFDGFFASVGMLKLRIVTQE